MKVVFKYPVPMNRNTIEMPSGAQILSLQLQNDVPCIWALVSKDASMVVRSYHWLGTGEPGDVERLQYLGTVQEDMFVWHLFMSNEEVFVI